MIRPALLSLLIAGSAWAQEIGSEIPATPPPADPYATPPPAAPTPAPAAKPGPAAAPAKAAASAGGSGSAASGAFGMRATFFGSPTSNLPTAAVGVALLLTDMIKLTVDAGVAANIIPYPGNSTIGFTVAAGADILFRTPAASVRPFLSLQVGFGKLVSDRGDDFSLIGNVGGGAEYFFSPQFSVNIRGLVTLPVNFKTGAIGIVLFTPGVGATVYF